VTEKGTPVNQSREEIRGLVENAWHRVLGGSGGYADTDDFFNIGGHSLLALHVVDDLAAQLGRDVSVRVLFTNRQLAEFVSALEAAA
jgi:hypothetical protein